MRKVMEKKKITELEKIEISSKPKLHIVLKITNGPTNLYPQAHVLFSSITYMSLKL